MLKMAITYLVIINLVGVYSMWSDKMKSIKSEWRIPENTLFVISLIGGAFGILVGMKQFRHKTQHIKFKYGIPIILLIQVYVAYKIY